MEVILLERIEKLGQMGDVVKVKDGFARNFLLPQKKALRASDDNLAYFEKERVTLEANNIKQKKEAEIILKKLDNYNLIVIRQAGETGQLYGSVNTNDIKIDLGENGFILFNSLFSTYTISPFSTSLMYLAPIISKAHVSDVNT